MFSLLPGGTEQSGPRAVSSQSSSGAALGHWLLKATLLALTVCRAPLVSVPPSEVDDLHQGSRWGHRRGTSYAGTGRRTQLSSLSCWCRGWVNGRGQERMAQLGDGNLEPRPWTRRWESAR